MQARIDCDAPARATYLPAHAVHTPKEIVMRNPSILRKSIIAGSVMLAFAAAPFSLLAQSASPASGMPQQQQQQAPATEAPSSMTPSSTTTQSSSNETVPGKVDDTWITTKVKSKLAAAKGVKASDISVSTTDGAVTLTGTATSAKEKTRVEHLAKQVKGVKTVDGSGLTVSAASSSSGGSMQPSSQQPPSSG
jgi:hyperosmotically inducible periplasmic protein